MSQTNGKGCKINHEIPHWLCVCVCVLGREGREGVRGHHKRQLQDISQCAHHHQSIHSFINKYDDNFYYCLINYAKMYFFVTNAQMGKQIPNM